MNRSNNINLNEVEYFLHSRKKGIIDIGILFHENNDYKAEARSFIEKHYAFDIGDVLFKTTFTNEVVFRNNPEDALSYFISGDIPEDSGFAIKPWQDIEASEVNFLVEDSFCAVMGVLNLKSLNSENQTKIAFTFILVKDENRIKIKIHHSSEIKQ
ncbi:MAG: hypothetical protein P8M36_05980 [Gammaproteobacteria bacterium]|nr:hypothetical protein [Gammaproteobacteria bacterium]